MRGTMQPEATAITPMGLAVYFLLAALLNAAAAAWVAYGVLLGEGISDRGLRPRTRHLPGWLLPAVGGLYALGTLLGGLAGGRGPLAIAGYALAALANSVLAVQAGADAAHHAEVYAAGHGREQEFAAPSLNDHLPPAGLGRPMNRTLWSLVWAVVAVVFQAIGLVLALGARLGVPGFVHQALAGLAGPAPLAIGALLVVAGLYLGRRVWVRGLAAWAVVDVLLLAFGVMLTDPWLRPHLTEPRAVVVLALAVVLAGAGWLLLRRLVIRDARQAAGLPVHSA